MYIELRICSSKPVDCGSDDVGEDKRWNGGRMGVTDAREVDWETTGKGLVGGSENEEEANWNDESVEFRFSELPFEEGVVDVALRKRPRVGIGDTTFNFGGDDGVVLEFRFDSFMLLLSLRLR